MGALSHVASAAGGALLLLLLGAHRQASFELAPDSESQARSPARKLAAPKVLDSLNPRWNETVLPPNIIDIRLPVVKNPNYGIHVFALGANGSIWHKFQTGPVDNSSIKTMPMSGWHCLTKNATLVWGNDPSVVVNADGHIELFVGLKVDSLDVWQMYQTDPKNPLAWSEPRAPACICEDPDPSKCPWCDNCNARPECSKDYWMGWVPFTTSDIETMLDPVDNKVKLHYRNFEGHVYQISQAEPSKSDKWATEAVQLALFE